MLCCQGLISPRTWVNLHFDIQHGFIQQIEIQYDTQLLMGLLAKSGIVGRVVAKIFPFHGHLNSRVRDVSSTSCCSFPRMP